MNLTLQQYIEHFLMIQTKDGQLVPLHFNYAQRKFYDLVKECYNNDKPCKIIVLKARQLGISTVTEAVISAICMTTYFQNALIVAHNADSSTHIYDMARRYYENLPKSLKPMLKYSNAKELRFANPNQNVDRGKKGLRSSIRVATAGQSGVGRSNTFNMIHLSELAFWEEQDGQTVADQLTGLLQTLPQHGFSLLVIESTANGYNYFKSLWDMAESGENDFIPLFIPWWEMEEYRLPWHNEEFSPEEESVKKKFGLDNEQVMWRRYAIRNLCGNDLNKFKQEYPSSPEEAFILSGSPVFDVQKILARMQDDLKPKRVGMFTAMGNFYDDRQGYVSVWEEPVVGHTYVMGCDTSGEGSDWFVAYVLDKDKQGRMVARYRSQTDEGLFVQQIAHLGYWYNYAMIAVETNFSSYPTMKLQEMGYLNMYVREAVDTYQARVQKKFGFRTTSLTRPLIIDNLVDIVREHTNLIYDMEFCKEALSFVKNDRGKPEAAEGAHDDCVMALAIAFYTMPQARTTAVADSADVLTYGNDVQSFLDYGG